MNHSPTSTQLPAFQPKRILITGGAGFIGSHLIHFILHNRPDYEIVNLDLLTYAGHLDSLKDIVDNEQYTFIQGDICDFPTVESAISNCDCIINLAAETHVDRSIANSTPFMKTNTLGTQVLLENALNHSIKKFIQVSTDEVYGSLSLNDPNRFTEQSPLQPNSPYAASKAAADLLTLAYHRTYHLPAIITRCTNNFGPYQYPEKLIPFFVARLLKNKKVPLYGDGLNVRDWIHVIDHAEALLAALEFATPGEIYNIGAENEQSNLNLTKQLIKLCDRDHSQIEFVEDRPGHDRRYAVNPAKIKNNLSWHATRSDWPAALEQTVNWYREHQDWCADKI